MVYNGHARFAVFGVWGRILRSMIHRQVWCVGFTSEGCHVGADAGVSTEASPISANYNLNPQHWLFHSWSSPVRELYVLRILSGTCSCQMHPQPRKHLPPPLN